MEQQDLLARGVPSSCILLTVEELQTALGISRTKAYELVSLPKRDGTREIPSVKIGRSVRVRLSEVERYLEGCAR